VPVWASNATAKVSTNRSALLAESSLIVGPPAEGGDGVHFGPGGVEPVVIGGESDRGASNQSS
jgi:hypothetical protein